MKYKLQIIPVFVNLILTLTVMMVELENKNFDIYHLVGLCILLVAFIFWIIARFQLGEAFSVFPKAKFLVTRGVYSKIRHPVYVFSSLALLGLIIFFRNVYLIALLLLVIVIQTIRVKKEEQILLEMFGERYKQYKETTWF